VNKVPAVSDGPTFDHEALRVLRSIPGVTVVAHELRGRRRQADALLRFAGTQVEIAVEVKGRANAATAWQLVQYARENPGTPLLLIADETTAEARSILREHDVALVDALGNAHLEIPGLLVHLEGDRRRTPSPPPVRLRGKAGIVAQALLLEPSRVWQIRELVERAQVSSGLAHRVISRLDREGVTASEGSGPRRVRRVANPSALLDLWAEEDDARLTRTPAYLLARSPQELITRLAENLRTGNVGYAVTGAGAASLLAPFLTAVPVVEVWATPHATPEELFAAARAEPVDEGQNIVFLQGKDDSQLSFSEEIDGVWTANRFRIYADLLRDPRRGVEQAKHLRHQVIGF
jgi:hypothetical protein